MPGTGSYRDSQLILNLPVLYTPSDVATGAGDIGYGVNGNYGRACRGVRFQQDGNVVFVPYGPGDANNLNTEGTSVTIAVKGGIDYPWCPKRLASTGHTAGTVHVWLQ